MNDSLLTNFKNVAASGELYFYIYTKFQEILIQNPQIEVVFIEFTNTNIKKSKEKLISSNNHIYWYYPSYSPFMNIKDQMLLLKQNPFGFIDAFCIATRKNTHRIQTSNYDFTNKMGGYLSLKRNKIDSLLAAHKKYPIEAEKEISDVETNYLEKILSYCKKHQKKVYLIRSPQHPSLPILANEKIFQKVLKKITSNRDIQFLDFNRFPLKNSEYADLDHLNYKGATLFSKWLNDLIFKKGLLQSEDKQKLIQDNMTPQIVASYRNPNK